MTKKNRLQFKSKILTSLTTTYKKQFGVRSKSKLFDTANSFALVSTSTDKFNHMHGTSLYCPRFEHYLNLQHLCYIRSRFRE